MMIEKAEEKVRNTRNELDALKELQVGEYVSLMVTLCDGNYLIKVGIKFKKDKVKSDTIEYYNEPESRKEIYELLPEHIKSFGNIVEIDHLFDIDICL